MAPSSISWSLPLVLVLGWVSLGRACFCDHYPWGSWSACSRTCNYGTQDRVRRLNLDDYYWKNSCQQLCQSQERRGCNAEACPIQCQLSEFGPWSQCSPCAKKQLRTRSVLTPSQFEGVACSVELTEERPCHPAEECKMPPLNCREDFQCENGRCIASTLTCNRQDDCGDGTDERNCESFTTVCPVERRAAPGIDLAANGFDALADEPRGAVLDNMFMGGTCDIKRPKSTLLYHRVPYNFQTFDIQVGVVEDFAQQMQPVKTQTINTKSEVGTHPEGQGHSWLLAILLNSAKNFKEVIQASKTTDSQFFRVHKVLPVSRFKVRDPTDLVLSGQFLQFLDALPLDYNYALYRDIFRHFGTHYYSSGALGGHYDLLYQYSRELILNSGESKESVNECLTKDATWTCVFYTEEYRVTKCTSNKLTQKYQGSIVQAAEKSFSRVKGGRAREAAALAWEKTGPVPGRPSYINWAKSVIDNPAVVDYELLPIIDLVRGIPCAATKRRHLRKALLQYLLDFDPCKCAPCPNNARPVLSGTECKCICQTGTFGANCEIRAQDYTSEAVDGYWSCWGPWSDCGGALKRRRTRQCNNPAPLNGGQACPGARRQEEPCNISIFQKQDSCDNDDDFTMGWRDELPPGVEGCTRPTPPQSSRLIRAKQYYKFGEQEEFQCFTGSEMHGYPFINCLPDGTWSQARGRCQTAVSWCLAPVIPEVMTLSPPKERYQVGQSVGLECKQQGMAPTQRGFYSCIKTGAWDPPLPANLACGDASLYAPDRRCDVGKKLQGSECVCVPRESCLLYPAVICVLNTDVGLTVPMSVCAFNAGRCHGDPLLFVNAGPCDPSKLDWAKFRAEMAPRSSTSVPCGLDTCLEWETCSGARKCECKTVHECPKGGVQQLCVMLALTQSQRSMSLCTMAALKCADYQLEVLSEQPCAAK